MATRILDFRERVFLAWSERLQNFTSAAHMADQAVLALYPEQVEALFDLVDGRLSLKVW